MNKKKYLGAMLPLLLICAGLTGCGKRSSETEYKQITQKEAKEMMDSESGYILLDVRTKEEYDEVHIDGAICIPVETIGDSAPAELPDKEQKILVYCRSGNRSKKAAEKLAKLGYTNILEFGGIQTWEYEVVRE